MFLKFIHVVARISHSFPLLSRIPYAPSVAHIWGCFHVEAVTNNVLQTLHSCAKSSCGHTFSLHLGRYLGIELLDCILKKRLNYVPKQLCHLPLFSLLFQENLIQPPVAWFSSHNEYTLLPPWFTHFPPLSSGCLLS